MIEDNFVTFTTETFDCSWRIPSLFATSVYAGIKLVDFKVEFGKTKLDETIILADEISPDTCRLWDQETEKKLDKDRFRKDLGDLIPAYTEVAKRLGILHEQSNVMAVNVTKLSSVKRKKKWKFQLS